MQKNEKHDKMQDELFIKPQKNKDYIPPVLGVIFVEMECGIAANSAAVSPVTTGTDPVQTDWNGDDDTTVNVPFDNF